MALTYRLPDFGQFWSILVMTLILNSQGQTWNLLYLSQKWSDCHKIKTNILLESYASNVTTSFDLGHDLDLEFSGQIWNLLYLTQKWSDCHEGKPNISIELQASNVTNGFDLDHAVDLWIFKVKCDLDLWPNTWPWPWIFMVKFLNSCISEWEGRLTLTMTVTIWWPRLGVRIYQIVTRMISDVGVPSTHLVWINAH